MKVAKEMVQTINTHECEGRCDIGFDHVLNMFWNHEYSLTGRGFIRGGRNLSLKGHLVLVWMELEFQFFVEYI